MKKEKMIYWDRQHKGPQQNGKTNNETHTCVTDKGKVTT